MLAEPQMIFDVESRIARGRLAADLRDRDRELVASLRRHEPRAADALIDMYGSRAYRLAARITGNAQDAEEAVQDAFWSAIRKVDTFRGDSTFSAWLYRIVANAAYSRVRPRRSRGADLRLDHLIPVFQHGRHVEPVTDWLVTLDDPAHHTELRVVLAAAVDDLPPRYRAAVLLRDVDGLSHQQIGESLGLSISSVKMRLHRRRLLLRKRLERLGVTADTEHVA
jgi:RNA polymerase sigma-70 factor, ECF subfamily